MTGRRGARGAPTSSSPRPSRVGPNTRIAGDAVNAAIARGGRARSARASSRRGAVAGGSTTHDPPLRRCSTPSPSCAARPRPATCSTSAQAPLRSRGSHRRRLRPPRAGPARRQPRSTWSRRSTRAPPSQAPRVLLGAVTARRSSTGCAVSPRRPSERPGGCCATLQRSQRQAASRAPAARPLRLRLRPARRRRGRRVRRRRDPQVRCAHASYVRGRGSRWSVSSPTASPPSSSPSRAATACGPRAIGSTARSIAARWPVVSNIVVLDRAAHAPDAFYNRQVWRAADGSVVNTIKPARAQPRLRQDEVHVAELVPEVAAPERGRVGALDERAPGDRLEHVQVRGLGLVPAGQQAVDDRARRARA